MTIQCDMPTASLESVDAFPNPPADLTSPVSPQTLVLSGGCFWCTEGVYRQLDGVLDVVSGYAGDSAETANYVAVSGGKTSHAEAVRIEYDPARVSFGRLLKVFFSAAHNPTHVDRQGDDLGRHYRSTIFYADPGQHHVAAAYIDALNAAKVFGAPIATTLEPLSGFYPAEAEFQNYVERNPDDPYVQKTSMPKVRKVLEHFPEDIKGSRR